MNKQQRLLTAVAAFVSAVATYAVTDTLRVSYNLPGNVVSVFVGLLMAVIVYNVSRQ